MPRPHDKFTGIAITMTPEYRALKTTGFHIEYLSDNYGTVGVDDQRTIMLSWPDIKHLVYSEAHKLAALA